MTDEEVSAVRKVASVLSAIERGDRLFFNVARFRKLGLVEPRTRWGTDASGNRVSRGTEWRVTELGRTIMENPL